MVVREVVAEARGEEAEGVVEEEGGEAGREVAAEAAMVEVADGKGGTEGKV